VERNPLVFLQTTGRHQVEMSAKLNSNFLSDDVVLVLNFTGEKCTISSKPGVTYTITGEGEFKQKQFIWGNKLRDGIVIHYEVFDGTHTYIGDDTMVLRDKGIVLETFEPLAY